MIDKLIPNNIDLAFVSLVVAFATLAFSVLSALFSALISGIFRIIEKKLDIANENNKYHRRFYEEHRAEVIEHYIRSVSNRMAGLTSESESDYVASMSEVLLYLDESLWHYVFEINGGIDTNDDSTVISSLISLSKELSKDGIRK